jgi:hypothetical protein
MAEAAEGEAIEVGIEAEVVEGIRVGDAAEDVVAGVGDDSRFKRFWGHRLVTGRYTN